MMAWLDNKKKEFVFIAGIFIVCTIAIIVGISMLVRNGDVDLHPYKEGKWQTYTSSDYGFTIKYPSSWTYEEGTVAGIDPVVSFYPKTEKLPPPYSHHSQATHVSVYPQGVSTEGVFGQFSEKKIDDLKVQREFYLKDGDIWATMINFDQVVEEKENWKAWGFIWGSQEVKDLNYSCLKGSGIEAPIDNCDPFVGDEIVRSGNINQNIEDTIKKIIDSFEFVE